MTYTEIKEKNNKKYYYRVKSIRKGKKIKKQRIYLGVNLKKEQLKKAEINADKKLKSQDKYQKSLILKEESPAEWYSQVCLKAELANYGPVKGTMIIRPRGYALWEKIQEYFNKQLKTLNIKNAYFPMFIPESFFKKEAEHAKGFSPEVAWLESKSEGEKIALRPTSETIIYDSYSKWIRSWRDLPLRLNQWCNIVRWEVSDCKLFIRSREFLWQEGHCVYETKEQCDKEVLLILNYYKKLCKDLLAIPVIKGRKTEKEKFAGAEYTMAIETFTPEGKALQCGTSHQLGQGFAKAFNITYLDKNEKPQFPWQSSWGISTRLIGATVIMHSDNKGLVLPPKLAPTQIIIIPIYTKENKKKILKKARQIKEQLKELPTELDDREEHNPGYKFNEWELKGIPLRIEIGEKDLKKNSVVLVRRDNGEKKSVKINQLNNKVKKELENMQKALYKKAQNFLRSSIKKTKEWDEFLKIIKNKKMALSPFCGGADCENQIKEKTVGATSRVIEKKAINEKCIHCKKQAKFWVYFAKAY